MTATPSVRHLQQLEELINRVVREAELIHDYVELRFHGGLVLKLNNAVELDGHPLSNSPSGRTLLASIVGRTLGDIARAADRIVLNFRSGPTLTMSLQSPPSLAHEPLKLSRIFRFSLRYTGQIMLAEPKLYHYKARVYDPGIGRFLQTDPIGYEGDLNLYAYVRNDPLNRVDPTGLAEDCPAGTGDCKTDKAEKTDKVEKRQSSATLRKKWERFWNKTWPKDPKTGGNQQVAHKVAVADKGAPNDVENYDPKPRDEHMREHKEKGDFKRWGARSSGGRAQVRGMGGVLSALTIIPSVLDLNKALQQHPDLPFSAQLGILSGTLDPEGMVQTGEGEYMYVPAELRPTGT